MAKFTLTIETDDAGELASVADAIAFQSPSDNPNLYWAQSEAEAPAEMQKDEEDDKPKRTRRTKRSEPDTPSPEADAAADESDAAEIATLCAGKVEATTGVTLERLKGAMEKLTSVMPPLEIQKLLIESFNVKGAGALQPAQYGACYAMLGEAYALAGGK